MTLREAPSDYAIGGGSLPADAATYVVRQVDEDFHAALRQSELCYVLNARQMGKSSLRVRTAARLRAEGVVCAALDLKGIGTEGMSALDWYAGAIHRLGSPLQLFREVGFSSWWREQEPLPPVQRLTNFFEEVLLARIAGEIVLFFDEIDNLLGLDFGDDFFGLLRACQDRRAERPEYRRLTFALLGVANPAELIRDRRRSPFNVGRAIPMAGFRLAEARPALGPGLAASFADPEAVLREILAWTGGQPFLTQKLCWLAVHAGGRPAPGGEAAWVTGLVRSEVIEDWEGKDVPEHLRTVRDRLLESGGQRTGRRLGLYQRIHAGQEVAAADTDEIMDLRLSGLVTAEGGRLAVANRTYAAVFDSPWIDRKLTELRPYAASIDVWLASGGEDPSCLVQGNALVAARAWAQDKSLSDDDYKFLAASAELERRGLAVAERKARRRVAVGSVILAFSILALVATMVLVATLRQRADAEEARAEKAAAQVREREASLEKLEGERDLLNSSLADKTKVLEQKETELSTKQDEIRQAATDLLETRTDLRLAQTSLQETQILGEAMRYVAAIGQGSGDLTEAEAASLQALAQSPSEEARFRYLRKALEDRNTAFQLSNRIDLAVQAAVGLVPERRERVLREIVLPCLRDPEGDRVGVRIVCAELATTLAMRGPEVADLVLEAVRSEISSTTDDEGLARLVGLLQAVTPDFAPASLWAAFRLTVERLATGNTNYAQGGPLELPRADVARPALSVMAPRLAPEHRAAAAALILDQLKSAEGAQNVHLWSEVLAWIPGPLAPEQGEAARAEILRRESGASGDELAALRTALARIAGETRPEGAVAALDPRPAKSAAPGTSGTGPAPAIAEARPGKAGEGWSALLGELSRGTAKETADQAADEELAATARVLPGTPPAEAVVAALRQIEDPCQPGVRPTLLAVLAKMDREREPAVEAELMAKLSGLLPAQAATALPAFSCWMEGLVALRGDITLGRLEGLDSLLIFLTVAYAPRDLSGLIGLWAELSAKIRPQDAADWIALQAQTKLGSPSVAATFAAAALPRVAVRVEPDRAPEVLDRFLRVVAYTTLRPSHAAIAEGLRVLPGRLDPQKLIELLKQPYCVGPLRSAALTQLERQAGQSFGGSLWPAVAWARDHGLDVSSPPLTFRQLALPGVSPGGRRSSLNSSPGARKLQAPPAAARACLSRFSAYERPLSGPSEETAHVDRHPCGHQAPPSLFR